MRSHPSKPLTYLLVVTPRRDIYRFLVRQNVISIAEFFGAKLKTTPDPDNQLTEKELLRKQCFHTLCRTHDKDTASPSSFDFLGPRWFHSSHCLISKGKEDLDLPNTSPETNNVTSNDDSQ